MQPFDYRIAVQDPLQMALAGYQQGQNFQQQRVQGERETQLYNMEMQQYQANQAKLQKEQAEAEAMQTDFAAFNEALINGTATIDDVLRINARHPAIAEQVQAAYQMKTDVQKNSEIQRSLRLASLFKNAPEKGAEELKNEIAAAEAAGDMERVAALKNIEATIPISPTAPITATLFSLVNLMPEEQFKTVSETLMPKAPEAASSAGKVIADYNAGLFGEVGSPEAMQVRDDQLTRAGGGQTININPELSAGFKAMDQSFAPIAVEWQTGGGSDALSQLVKIEDVISRVDSGENISGGVTGFAPDLLRAIVDPNAQDAKETVEDVVQRNLRVILGAQFTAAEGERLVARAFNPRLSPEINRKRLQRLFTQMRLAAEQKQEMVNYFRTRGTLVGYDGRQPSMNDFYTAIEGTGGGNQTADQATIDEILSQLPE